MIDVVADEMGRSFGDLAVHVDSFLPAEAGDSADGVCGVGVDFAVPAELGEPGEISRVDFCETALSERDFAVSAEAVGVDGQAGFEEGVGVDVGGVCGAE